MAPAAGQSKSQKERGSRVQGRTPEPRYLIIGQVVRPHGLRGELKVLAMTDDPSRYGLLDQVWMGREDEEPEVRLVEGYRMDKDGILLKLGGCDDRVTADALRGLLVQIPLEDALPLGEGEYYEHQILDLDVWTATGEHLGAVSQIIVTGANDVYVVQSPDPKRREILIPAIKDVVLEVDLEGGRLVVELPAGLP
ncbi:ribosome maturation factor RimM [Chloroflexota bacterium]